MLMHTPNTTLSFVVFKPLAITDPASFPAKKQLEKAQISQGNTKLSLHNRTEVLPCSPIGPFVSNAYRWIILATLNFTNKSNTSQYIQSVLHCDLVHCWTAKTNLNGLPKPAQKTVWFKAKII